MLARETTEQERQEAIRSLQVARARLIDHDANWAVGLTDLAMAAYREAWSNPKAATERGAGIDDGKALDLAIDDLTPGAMLL
jgi:hypothetical protein